jgi:hypothetical protein
MVEDMLNNLVTIEIEIGSEKRALMMC